MSSHCTTAVREAVAAPPTATQTTAMAATMPHRPDTGELPAEIPQGAAHGRGWRCSVHHSQAQAPRLSSVACWLRWRRLPMAWPGVEGCTHGAPPGSPRKYCASPMPAATSAASTSAALQQRAQPRRGQSSPASSSAASTPAQAHEASQGQKLALGGRV